MRLNRQPAFPNGTTYGQKGMSVRVWLAGQALAGYNANPSDQIVAASSEQKAGWATDDAEALIEGLEAGEPEDE